MNETERREGARQVRSREAVDLWGATTGTRAERIREVARAMGRHPLTVKNYLLKLGVLTPQDSAALAKAREVLAAQRAAGRRVGGGPRKARTSEPHTIPDEPPGWICQRCNRRGWSHEMTHCPNCRAAKPSVAPLNPVLPNGALAQAETQRRHKNKHWNPDSFTEAARLWDELRPKSRNEVTTINKISHLLRLTPRTTRNYLLRQGRVRRLRSRRAAPVVLEPREVVQIVDPSNPAVRLISDFVSLSWAEQAKVLTAMQRFHEAVSTLTDDLCGRTKKD